MDAQIIEQWVKIAVLGDGGVGKTALCQRLTEDKFEEQSLEMTIGANVYKYELENQLIKGFFIFDLGGQDAKTSPETTSDVFVRGSSALLLLYDITSIFSFMSLTEFWLPFINKHVPKIPIILIGNKHDISEYEEVTINLVKAFISENRGKFNIGPHLRVSAKTGENIPKLILKIIEIIVLYQRFRISD